MPDFIDQLNTAKYRSNNKLLIYIKNFSLFRHNIKNKVPQRRKINNFNFPSQQHFQHAIIKGT